MTPFQLTDIFPIPNKFLEETRLSPLDMFLFFHVSDRFKVKSLSLDRTLELIRCSPSPSFCK